MIKSMNSNDRNTELCRELIRNLVELNTNVMIAQRDLSRRSSCIELAIDILDKIKFVVIILTESFIITTKQSAYIATYFESIGKQLGGWKKTSSKP